MSFIAFSTATPQAGEEQPLSSTAKLVSSWTTLDISAAFPPAKTPYSVSALIILGADLPSSGLLGRMRVRKFGSTTSYEEAPGALGITSIVYRNDGEYQSGGYTAIVTILVDTDGKFEYQLQNDSVAPRTMVRILEVTTVEELPDATATPGPGKIPIADGAGKLDDWVSAPSVFKVVGSITVESSHTGDLLETVLGTITVPANEMGANGAIRVFSNWQGIGGNTKVFSIYFGAVVAAKRVGYGYHTAACVVAARLIEVWNKNNPGAQRCADSDWASGFWSHFLTNQTPNDLTVDTTQDVVVYFTGRLGAGGDTVKLLSAWVEVLHQD